MKIETKQFKKGTKEPETFEIKGGEKDITNDRRTDKNHRKKEKTDI